MHENGATTNNRGGVICCEPRVWLENGVFPVEYADATGPTAPLDAYFTETLDRLWRAVLSDPADQAAYRRYEPLLWPGERAQTFIARLSPDALRRFLAAAGDDWRTPPREPTCDHVACHREYLFAADEWDMSQQARWPALAAPGAPSGRRVAARRWPRPRTLPWEDGDGDAAR